MLFGAPGGISLLTPFSICSLSTVSLLFLYQLEVGSENEFVHAREYLQKTQCALSTVQGSVYR